MRYVRFGQSELNVSRLGLDCYHLGVARREQGWDPFSYDGRIFATRTVHAALDAGINVFQIPPDAGGRRAESLLGQALRGRRPGVLLATTITSASEDWCIEDSLRASMRRLRTDTIDIAYVQDTLLTSGYDGARRLGEIESLRAEGSIGHVGLLISDPTRAGSLIESGAFEAVQLQCDIASPAGSGSLIERAQQNGLGISIAKSLGSKNLQSLIDALDPAWRGSSIVRERCLEYLLSDWRVHMINVGMRWEHEVVQNSILFSGADTLDPALPCVGAPQLGAA